MAVITGSKLFLERSVFIHLYKLNLYDRFYFEDVDHSYPAVIKMRYFSISFSVPKQICAQLQLLIIYEVSTVLCFNK